MDQRFDIDELRAIRVLAMKNVLDAESGEIDYEYFLRKLHRWYSETFHEPYSQALDVPLADLFRHFYEHKYERLEDVERDEEAIELCETIEETKNRKKKKEEETRGDDDFFKKASDLAKKKNKVSTLDGIVPLPKDEAPLIPTLGGQDIEVPTLTEEERAQIEKMPSFDMDFANLKEEELEVFDVLGLPKKKPKTPSSSRRSRKPRGGGDSEE